MAISASSASEAVEFEGTEVVFNLENLKIVPEEDRPFMKEILLGDGLIDGQTYGVIKAHYVRVSPGIGEGLERAVTEVKEPYTVFDLEVNGKIVSLGSYLFDKKE